MKKVFVIVILFLIIIFPVYAQDLTTKKAFDDFIFSQDNYRASLTEFNLKKGSYQKNPTLSLKEEARVSLYDFLTKRNDYKRNANFIQCQILVGLAHLKVLRCSGRFLLTTSGYQHKV